MWPFDDIGDAVSSGWDSVTSWFSSDSSASSSDPWKEFFKAAGTGMQLAGLYSAGQGAYVKSQADQTAYKYQADVTRYNATIDEERAKDAITRGQITTVASRLKQRQIEGTQRASFAARGIDAGFGSALNVLADTRFMGDVDAATITDNASREAWALRQQAFSNRSNADILDMRAGMESPVRSATNTLMSTATAVAPSWYRLATQS